jgi:hypothetical protein
LKVTDSQGKRLEMITLNVNQPQEKKFRFELDREVPPGKSGFARIEWDWEEPKRYFYYTFASRCRHFQFLVTLPRAVNIAQRVYRVEHGVEEKTYSTPAKIRYGPNKLQMTWSAEDIPAYDGYEFHW